MVQLKKFNYSFKNNLNKIDDLEKEPAYKRHGLKLDQEDNTSTETKLIIETDDNDEIQLKSNNSFLHDNVD
jgi:cell division protein FtsZ